MAPLDVGAEKLADQKDKETDDAKEGEPQEELRENGQKIAELREQYNGSFRQ